jgi:hypothetical protein
VISQVDVSLTDIYIYYVFCISLTDIYIYIYIYIISLTDSETSDKRDPQARRTCGAAAAARRSRAKPYREDADGRPAQGCGGDAADRSTRTMP